MAFISIEQNSVTTESVVYTSTGVTTVIIGFAIAPTSGGNAIVNAKKGAAHLIKGLTITAGTANSAIQPGQKVVLTPGQTLSVSSDTAVDVVISGYTE